MTEVGSAKKRVLIIGEYFPPAEKAGGPLRTLQATAQILAEDYQVFVLSRGFDLGARQPLAGIVLDTWIWGLDGRVKLYYGSKGLSPGTYRRILRECAPDLIFINSFFSPRYSFLPLIFAPFDRRQYLCAPRGELAPEALRIKPLKKKLYLVLTRFLWGRFRFVFSSAKERAEAMIIFGPRLGTADVIAEPISLNPIASPARPLAKAAGQLRAVFVARIHPIKNLRLAIECIAQTLSATLDIYGPINSVQEQAYWDECALLISKLSVGDRIRYHGPVANDMIGEILRRAHLLMAPSLSENFGHSILEALLQARPVLISDRTPWSEVTARGFGQALALEQPTEFVQALKFYRDLDENEFAKISAQIATELHHLYNPDQARRDWKRLIAEVVAS